MMNDGALHELPGDWVWTTFEEISTNRKNAIVDGPFGSNLKVSDYIDDENGVPVLTTKNLECGYKKPFLRYISKNKFEELKRSEVKGGDILIAKIGSCGKAAIYPEYLGSAMIPANLLKMTVHSEIKKIYVFYFLKSLLFKSELEKIITATAQPAFNVTKFRRLPIPLPPLPEQGLIVSKVEQLFSDLDNGIQNFKKAQAQLKLYRQSVLKAACEGKLVPTEAELAQAEGRDYEAAEVLLARILKERREKWNGKGKYKEPAAADTRGLGELPEGWKWVSIDQISNLVTDGDHNPPKRVASGISHLTAKNIKNWQISEEGCTYIIEQDFEKVCKRYFPIRGDIIITCVGTIGRTAIVPENYIFSADRNLAVVRLIFEGLNEKLMQFYLNTPAAQNSMSTASGSTAQPHLYLGKIRIFPVPLPPLAEQRRIVAEVERRLSISDKMEATITESLQKAEALRQSILKKAFEGKLLNEKELEEARNAPDWEPAEKLLERIRQEKQIKDKNNKPTRRKTHG